MNVARQSALMALTAVAALYPPALRAGTAATNGTPDGAASLPPLGYPAPLADALTLDPPPLSTSATPALTPDRVPLLLWGLTRFGVPVPPPNGDDPLASPRDPAADGAPRIRVSTDQLRLLLGLARRSPPAPSESSGLAVRSAFDRDGASGQYQISRVEVGLLGRRLWLVHEPGQHDESGRSGVRVQFRW